MRAAYRDIEERDTQVLGISTNARATQTAFSTALGGISYPILADFHPHGEVAKLYGIFNEKLGTALRSIFVVDKAGIVRFKRTYASAGDIHVPDILAELDKL